MLKYLQFLLLLIGNITVFAQSVETSFHSLAGTNSQLPFWLWANQLGRYDKSSSTIQNFELAASHHSSVNESNFSYEVQTRLNFLLAEDNAIHVTELYGDLNWKYIQIKVGSFTEKELYNGLSASNGNLGYSQNAQPQSPHQIGF